ncbi:histidine phosphatase family protein [Loktanella sp. D2R18]|uniref:histidine phosphatase family protein n=1 Tax=Rhodobacterales TaxID=204455 RepID=UPI000DE9D1FC|nr:MULTISPECIES: histidine phosphatase family protein [Rhodobacterales]MDO6592072.1 histidine phosphatase family protein [Yoonia sp. 1_MG-2023]RBW44797.1 histidine phosphatase family protein [Loktanella sp. D2R18]
MTYPEIYILRHGQTAWNLEGRMQGELNSPLTAQGRDEAARQGEILAECDLRGFAFISSPQGRAVQTAGIACAPLAELVRTDDRLREIGVGDWSGVLRDTLPLPDAPDPYMAQYEVAPNGEGLAAVKARCHAFLQDLKGPAVLVTHGVTGRTLREILAGPKAIEGTTIHGGQGCVYHLKNGSQNLLT